MDPIPSTVQREALRIVEAARMVAAFVPAYHEESLLLAARVLEREMQYLDPREREVIADIILFIQEERAKRARGE